MKNKKTKYSPHSLDSFRPFSVQLPKVGLVVWTLVGVILLSFVRAWHNLNGWLVLKLLAWICHGLWMVGKIFVTYDEDKNLWFQYFNSYWSSLLLASNFVLFKVWKLRSKSCIVAFVSKSGISCMKVIFHHRMSWENSKMHGLIFFIVLDGDCCGIFFLLVVYSCSWNEHN